jgi:hypothetical protein
MVRNGQLKDRMQSWICDTSWGTRLDVQSDDGIKSRDDIGNDPNLYHILGVWRCGIRGSIGTTCRILRT